MGTEAWTWAYFAQQVIMLGIWVFLLSAGWGEICAWRIRDEKDAPAKPQLQPQKKPD